MRDSFGGYCYANNACAAAVALTELSRFPGAGILDLDYHAGDGTSSIIKFLDQKNLVCASVHADPSLEYPRYSCYPEQSTDLSKHVVFPKKAKLSQYIECVVEAIQFLESKLPKGFALVIAFGSDTYIADPDVSKSYGCGLQVDDYLALAKHIRKMLPETPILVTQEGGYSDKVPEITMRFLFGLTT